MRIVRREVSKGRRLLHFIILAMLGGYLAEYYIQGNDMFEMFCVFGVAQLLSGIRLDIGDKYTKMLCLERGEHSCGDYIVSLDEGSRKCMKCGQEGMKR